jgi:hypothetical protein
MRTEVDLAIAHMTTTNISGKSWNLHHSNWLLETFKVSILNGNTAWEIGLCRAGLLVHKVKSWGHFGHSSIRIS